jgi:AcrR family transcriptional regulator
MDHTAGLSGTPESFIQRARRAQVVASAIAVMADVGYPKASFTRIAAHAGISPGLITYHFKTKDALVGAVVSEIVEAMESGEHDPEEFVEGQESAEGSADEPTSDDHAHDDHGASDEEEGTAYWLAHTDVMYFIDPEGKVQVLLRGDYTPEDLANNLKILAP